MKGYTVIYSTHYMEEAARLCSRIGVIDHGKIWRRARWKNCSRNCPFEEEIRFPR